MGLILCMLSVSAEESKVERVLFIGNSYTGVNDLPKIVGEIIKSAGKKSPVIRSSNPGGRTLEQHCSFPETLALIDEGSWDVVILQGHSMEAAQSEANPATRKSFLDSGKKLCGLIREGSPKARIIFYQTWARHADFWKTNPAAMGPVTNPQEMMVRIKKWYQQQAENNQASVAPVGEAWQLFYQKSPKLSLHDPDHSHPNFSGSYLAGLVFYAKIYQTPLPVIEYRGSLTKEQAASLREVAVEVLK